MLQLSLSEENYLKAVYHLSSGGRRDVTTNGISDYVHTKAASVTDMIKKLASKGMVDYEKYHGLTITKEGKREALKVIRKHRLWEVFLVDKLKLHWDEVHEIAEQLEHIDSPILIERLDEFLEHPGYDPHGDPIPDSKGDIKAKPRVPLNKMVRNTRCLLVGVKDSSSTFLRYLDKMGIHIDTKLLVVEKEEYDGSMLVEIDNSDPVHISPLVASNLLVTKQ